MGMLGKDLADIGGGGRLGVGNTARQQKHRAREGGQGGDSVRSELHAGRIAGRDEFAICH